MGRVELGRGIGGRILVRLAPVGLLAVTLAACASAGSGVGSSASTAQATAQVPPAPVVEAVAQARTKGTVTGLVEWVKTTTRTAAAITRDGPGSADVPIYAVQIHGHYVLEPVPRPPGATSPSGTDLVVFVPIPNNDNGGAGVLLTHTPVDLSPYGTFHTFQPG